MNLVPTPTQIANGSASASGSAWAQFWSDFNWYDGSVGCIKNQITFAKSLGCNCIRIIGNGGSGYWTGMFTQAQYLERQSQVIAYCASIGLSYYLTAGGFAEYTGYQTAPGGNGTTTGFGAITAWVRALLAAAAPFPNVIGCDLCSEAFSIANTGQGIDTKGTVLTGAQAIGFLQQLTAAARLVAPDMPIAFSWTTNSSFTVADGTNAFTQCSTYSDHIDRHIYYNLASNGVPGDMDSVSQCYNKQLFVGEHGWAESNGDSAIVAQLASIQTNVINNNSIGHGITPVGGNAWAAIPQDTASSNDWGFEDSSGNIRPVGTAYAAYPSYPRAAARRRRRRI